jgi:hypothetical protein
VSRTLVGLRAEVDGMFDRNSPWSVPSVLLALVTSACSPDLTVPAGALLTCGSAADCPSGLVCHAGICADPGSIDSSPPDLAAAPVVTPPFGRAGTPFTIELEATEPLLVPPTVTLGLVPPVAIACTAAGGNVHRCTYQARGDENGGLGGVVGFDVAMRDPGGNETVRRLVGALRLDFAAPQVSVATVAYLPGPGNPLPQVTAAGAGTEVRIALSADEVLDGGTPPSLVATLAGETLSFQHAGGDGASVLFSATVSAALPDGDYAARVTWSDEAGNEASRDLPAPVRVKTSRPSLAVDQALVTYLRSPWGNAEPEDLRACPTCAIGFTVPAGPYHALAPADPLAADSDLPASTFTSGGGSLAAVRIWSDAAGSALLATLSPGPTGAWARARLQNVDTPAAWATGLDPAGNESNPVRIENVEWVATARGAISGSSPHRVEASSYLAETFVPAPQTSLPATDALSGQDAQTFGARAQVALRKMSHGPRPTARRYHGMAYDSARGRVVMFGGMDPGNTRLGDTWEWDGRVWIDRTPPSGGPSPRTEVGMAYDARRGRVVLYGGAASGIAGGRETWEWDGSEWTRITPAGPDPGTRAGHSMAYDAARGRIVLFGGQGASPLDRTTWEWDGRAWSLVAVSTPPPGRYRHGMAFDASRGRVVLFGGRTDVYNSAFSDVWEFDGTGWTERSPAGAAPSARYDLTLAYDAARERVVLFGGRAIVAGSQVPEQDLREWDGTSWTLVTPVAGSAPGVREGHAVAYDLVARSMLVFGGLDVYTGTGLAEDETWEWNGAAWRDRTPRTGPPGRHDHAMAFDAARGRVVLFGGWSYAGGSNPWMNDLWEWDGVQWYPAAPVGPLPRGRLKHAMAYDPVAQRVVIFGGSGYEPALPFPYPKLNDVWDWDGTAFRQRTTSGGPPAARESTSLAFDSARGALVLFGGDTSADYTPVLTRDTWELTPGPPPGTWTWAQRATSPPASLPASDSHVLLYDGTRTLLLAGRDATVPVWQWNGTAWSSVPFTGAQPQASSLRAAWDGARGRAVVFGLYRSDDVWDWTGSGFEHLVQPPLATWPENYASAMAFDSNRGRAVLFDEDAATWEWDADVEPTAQGPRQRRAPMAQLTASFAGAGFSVADVQGIRVRARAGGNGGVGGPGAELLGWRTGGPGRLPGEWVPLASNADGLPLAGAPSGGLAWQASGAEAQAFLLERDAQAGFQLRPAGAPGPSEPEASLEADYLEVRVRYLAPDLP